MDSSETYKHEVDNTLDRILSHKGVSSSIVSNKEGIVVRPSKGMDDEVAAKISVRFAALTEAAKNYVKELDNADDLTFLRIRTKKHEILIAPEEEYLLITTQNLQN